MPGLIRRVRPETPKYKKQSLNPREKTEPGWPTVGHQLQCQARHARGPLHRLFPSHTTVLLTFMSLALLLAEMSPPSRDPKAIPSEPASGSLPVAFPQ